MHYSDKFAEERDDSKESHLAYTTPPPSTTLTYPVYSPFHSTQPVSHWQTQRDAHSKLKG